MTCVNVNLDIYHLKLILPHCGVCQDRKWQWPLLKDAAWRDLPLFSLNLSVPRTARSWRMWQPVSPNKVPWDREGWNVTPDGEKGWCVWRWQKEKRSFVASTEGYQPCDGWTMKGKSADLTPMTPISPRHPLCFNFFHVLSCLLTLPWSDLCDVRSRVWTVHHCVILRP